MKNALLIVLWVLFPIGIYAANVTNNKDDGSEGSLRYVLSHLKKEDNLIRFSLPKDQMEIKLKEIPITIDRDVTINGFNVMGGHIIISGGDKIRLFNIMPNIKVFFHSLILTNGIDYGEEADGRGGAIYNDGDLSLFLCEIKNCHSIQGGGIFNSETGKLKIERSKIHDCEVTNPFEFENYSIVGGGVCNWRGSCLILYSSFDNNKALPGTVDKNTAGGGLYTSGQCEVNNNSSFCNNTGGGIYSYFGKESNLKIDNGKINNNEEYGIFSYFIEVSNCEISNNNGEGIISKFDILRPDGQSIVNNCIISGNEDVGIDIYNGMVKNSTISNNHGGNGGGICIGFPPFSNFTNTVTVINTKIFNNTATNNGAGICFSGEHLIVIDCDIFNNKVLEQSDPIGYTLYGGGLYLFAWQNHPIVELKGITKIYDNFAPKGGNAIAYHIPTKLNIENSVKVEGDIKELPEVKENRSLYNPQKHIKNHIILEKQ